MRASEPKVGNDPKSGNDPSVDIVLIFLTTWPEERHFCLCVSLVRLYHWFNGGKAIKIVYVRSFGRY